MKWSYGDTLAKWRGWSSQIQIEMGDVVVGYEEALGIERVAGELSLTGLSGETLEWLEAGSQG